MKQDDYYKSGGLFPDIFENVKGNTTKGKDQEVKQREAEKKALIDKVDEINSKKAKK